MSNEFLGVGGKYTDSQNNEKAKSLVTDVSGNLYVSIKNQNLTKQSLIRNNSVTNIPSNDEFVILDWHDLSRNTLSWYLSFQEYNRPTNEIIDTLKIKIEYATISNPANVNRVFTKEVSLSLDDVTDKALVIPAEDDYEVNDNRVSNIILRGKPFNLPVARFIKITVINEATPTLALRGITFTEEGMF